MDPVTIHPVPQHERGTAGGVQQLARLLGVDKEEIRWNAAIAFLVALAAAGLARIMTSWIFIAIRLESMEIFDKQMLTAIGFGLLYTLLSWASLTLVLRLARQMSSILLVGLAVAALDTILGALVLTGMGGDYINLIYLAMSGFIFAVALMLLLGRLRPVELAAGVAACSMSLIQLAVQWGIQLAREGRFAPEHSIIPLMLMMSLVWGVVLALVLLAMRSMLHIREEGPEAGQGEDGLQEAPPGAGGVFAPERAGISKGVVGGIVMMAIAAVWFFAGLAAGYLFYYPPILFLIGVFALIKGLATGNVAGRR